MRCGKKGKESDNRQVKKLGTVFPFTQRPLNANQAFHLDIRRTLDTARSAHSGHCSFRFAKNVALHCTWSIMLVLSAFGQEGCQFNRMQPSLSHATASLTHPTALLSHPSPAHTHPCGLPRSQCLQIGSTYEFNKCRRFHLKVLFQNEHSRKK